MSGILRINAMLCYVCSAIIIAICLTRHDQNQDQDQPSVDAVQTRMRHT